MRSIDVAPLVVVVIILGIYVVLGCILESISMVLLTVPIFFPIIVALKLDPIWFGILVVVVTEISMITPPVGLNIFVINAMVPEVPTREIVRGLIPFIVAEAVLLAILVLLPGVVLFLPSFMR